MRRVSKVSNIHLCEVILQFSHDIRSPLSALSLTVASLRSISDHQRCILKESVRRINDLSNALLRSAAQAAKIKTVAECSEPAVVSKVIANIVSEKKSQYSSQTGVQISTRLGAEEAVVSFDRSELSRVLSNLIDNSVEAVGGSGHIEISVNTTRNFCAICINDNGKGIPPHVLSRLGLERISYGKNSQTSGFGLGIYHAKRTLESFGGKLFIKSKVSQGTQITIYVPRLPNLKQGEIS